MDDRTGIIVAVGGSADPAVVSAALRHPALRLRVVGTAPDAVALMGLVRAHRVRAAVVGPDLPGVNGHLIRSLVGAGVRVVAVATDQDSRRRAAGWRIPVVADAASVPTAVRAALTAAPDAQDGEAPAAPLFAVWTPPGGAGGTTVSVNIAGLWPGSLLIDADVDSASAAFLLGVAGTASGLVAACRRAELGLLTVSGLAELTRPWGRGDGLLTGVSGPARSAEVHAGALELVLQVAVRSHAAVVVDCPSGSAGTAGDLNRVILSSAAAVVIVARADPLGVQRLRAHWQDLDLAGSHPPVLVAWRGESGRGSPVQRRVLAAASANITGSSEVTWLPPDEPTVTRMWREGRHAQAVDRDAPLSRQARETQDWLVGVVPATSARVER